MSSLDKRCYRHGKYYKCICLLYLPFLVEVFFVHLFDSSSTLFFYKFGYFLLDFALFSYSEHCLFVPGFKLSWFLLFNNFSLYKPHVKLLTGTIKWLQIISVMYVLNDLQKQNQLITLS